MGLYDNPSADKFAPPPGSSDPQPTPTGPKVISGLAILAIVLFAFKFLGPMFERKSVAGFAIYLAVLWATSWIKSKRDEDQARGPYSPEKHVTH